MQEKALQLFPSLYPDEDKSSFKPILGWIHKFHLHHLVRELSLQGEALSADTSAVEPFCQLLKDRIETEGYCKCQIFNAVETGLWWILMPYTVDHWLKVENRPGISRNQKIRWLCLGVQMHLEHASSHWLLYTTVSSYTTLSTWIYPCFLRVTFLKVSLEWTLLYLMSGFIRNLYLTWSISVNQ